MRLLARTIPILLLLALFLAVPAGAMNEGGSGSGIGIECTISRANMHVWYGGHWWTCYWLPGWGWALGWR